MRTSPRVAASALALFLAAGLLVGCAPTPTAKDPSMKPEESKAALVHLQEETIAALGTAHWSALGGMPPQNCTLPSGHQGVNYGSYQLGPASADPDTDIATVEALWKSKGLKTTVKRSSNPADKTVRLLGSGDAVQLMEFDADTKLSSLRGESICVVGDATNLQNNSDDNG
jgi:hypothetical protein